MSSFLAPFASSFLLAAASEFGDKTQLFSASFNLRFGKPWQILGAATLASAANHLGVAILGRWIGFHLDPKILNLSVTCLFLVLALFTLLASSPAVEAFEICLRRSISHLRCVCWIETLKC